MKKTKIHLTFASLLIVQTITGQVGFAANLSYYRQHLPTISNLTKTDPKGSEIKAFSQSLRAKLSAGQDIQNLDFAKGPFNVSKSLSRGNRIYSSFIIKDLLHEATKSMGQEIVYGDDQVFNPEMSRLEIRKAQYEKYQALVIQTLLKKGSEVSIPVKPGESPRREFRSGVSQFLTLMKEWLVNKTIGSKSDMGDLDIVTGEVWAKDEERGDKVRLLKDHLSRGPKNKNGKSIEDVLGSLIGVSVVDSYVQRLKFAGIGAGEVPVSLTALLSERSGMDDVFLAVQQNILDYLQRQKDLLGRRQYYLSTNTALVALQNYFDYEEKQTLEAYSKVNGTAKTELQKIAKEKNIKDKYRDLYNKYYEGEATLGSSNEREFIERRLEQIDFVLSTMERRQQGALAINTKIAQLTQTQVDYLVDMMIQLRGTDLLSPKEVAHFGQDFALLQTERTKNAANPGEAEALSTALLADYQFYAMLNQELSSFDLWLTQKKRMTEGQNQDLQKIREKQ